MSLLFLVMMLVGGSGVRVETPTPCCDHGKDAKPWKGYEKIPWLRSLDEAKKQAQAQSKPILLFQLVGDLRLLSGRRFA